MKTSSHRPQRRSGGYALLLVLVFLGISTMLLTTIMNWTSETARLTDRQNEYYTTADAAEAATEKILTHISADYLAGGEQAVINNLNAYKTTYPLAADNPYWGNYTFSNASDGSQGVYVVRATNWQYTVLNSQYSGLFGYQATYRILANAQLTNNSRNGQLDAAVQQDVGLDSIPIFQFAIFYNQDLEMNPSPPMVVGGLVHANGNIYTVPSTSLTFSNDVTASGFITNTFKPGDPMGSRGIANPVVIFDAAHDAYAKTLNLPVGGDNSSSNVNQILQLPPPGETNASPLAHARLYNQADMIIVISDTNMTVSSGPDLGTNINVANSAWSQFLVDTNIIFNARENSYVRTTQLDVGKFRTWVESAGNPITPKLSGKTAINIVYIADTRTRTATISSTNSVTLQVTSITVPVEPGVELINGQQLPKAGLTVASPDPVYIVGDYNTTSDGANFSKLSNTTTFTRPAAVMGDSINVLSTAWVDANSLSPTRNAADTTVNAALLAGIVPTGNGFYSGGVENFTRFLENWSGKNFYYNGSMVVLFNSQIAKAPWGGAGVYSPPSRHWAFDVNFLDVNKLPPATPQVLLIDRLAWLFQRPGYVPL